MKIGKRTQITNLRQIWPTEPDFSDWLVTEEGLALISEDIGVFVENARRESRPGDYPADVVGHALGDEKHVIVIENQFGRTNHDHLGKLLTYAAMHSAMTGIWISEQISNDHRKVIDWLNENTPSHVSLYLAQLKAYRIGESPVAPQLDVVSRPNIQAKLQAKENGQDLTQIEKWRQKVWEDILNYIRNQNPPFSVQSASDDHWSNISIGRSKFWIGLTLVPKNQRIGCELAMNPVWKDEAFNQLIAQKDAIEKELGAALDWRPMSDNKSARVLLEAPIDPKDDDNRQAVKEWMFEQSVAFYKAFHDRVRKLKPNGNENTVQEGTSDQGNTKTPNNQTTGVSMSVHKTTVAVVEGSMLDQKVDAVVNAANEQMRGGNGIDGMIHQRAGRGLLDELKKVAPIGAKTGTAVITGGHGLIQPHIIHTPGPVWHGGASGEAKLLASSYRSCLEVADANGLKSIAFCSISTGIFGYPLDKAAPLAIKTVREYLDAHPDTSLERVVFAMYQAPEFQAFTQAWDAIRAEAGAE